MRTKHVLLGAGLVVLAGLLWAGNMAWRAHRQLVTLNVRNLPLREVLRKIEKQTWTKIRAEKGLDARITLQITDKPLAKVLDRISEQAGARWSAFHAVYGSKRALSVLESALQNDGKFEMAGWTKIAPAAPLDRPDEDGPGPMRQVRLHPGNGGPPSGQQRTVLVKRGPNGAMVIQDGNGQTETWSPEALVIEAGLTNRLGGEVPAATEAAAKETARKVHAKATTVFAFQKSKLGPGFAAMPRLQPGADPLRHNPNDRFARLTPEQRVQRARERLELAPK